MSEYENPILGISAGVKRRLAVDGRTNAQGLPNPLQGAALPHGFPQEFFYPPSVPAPVLRAAMAPPAVLARLRGYRGGYPQYVLKEVAA